MPEPPVRVGDILALRDEFSRTSRNSLLSAGATRRADLLVRILDEVIERREKEAANGERLTANSLS